ncbi:uncharacterized protein FIBRA_05711 [Fibroporia radiculosa]|uniref:Uncharacterized protein n=1 Tax=Fibroporia radiculosa TaxID=599839 RepID=J4GRH3_9APHY|nr:uncharacterized protein FIBRA_05711 [Fibroporia radiculosa]CCM03575.1 predicted protein [Fibroporia radiculosa]
MHPSLRLCSAGSVRQPLIHFLGKRQWPATPEAPHAHAFAPPELKQSFAEFVKKYKASGSSASSTSTASSSKSREGAQVFSEFWQAPERFWKHDLEEWEIELVETGGASRH